MNLVLKLRCQAGLELWHCPLPHDTPLPRPAPGQPPSELAELLAGQGFAVSHLQAASFEPQSDMLMFELFDLKGPPQFIDDFNHREINQETSELETAQALQACPEDRRLLVFGALAAQYWEFFAPEAEDFQPGQITLRRKRIRLGPELSLSFIRGEDFLYQGRKMELLYLKTLAVGEMFGPVWAG